MRIKKFYYSIAVILITVLSQATEVNAQQTVKITPSGTGYLEYLPDGYKSNSNKYPVVISLHGIGERGTSSSDPEIVKAGVMKVANVSLAKYIKYGQKYPFIVISPQLKSSYGTWPPDYVMSVINHVKKTLRIDERRIYLTGLSLGGYGTWKTAGAYPSVFAAIAPICSGGSDLKNACKIAGEDMGIWAFHGDKDSVVPYTVSTKMVNAINNCSPKPNPLAKMTIYPGMSHGIWDKAYKTSGVLDWMMKFYNGSSSSGTTPSNSSPTVSAGSDNSITLPTNYLYIQGSASDSDGSIASYKWTKVSGGTASMSGTTSSKVKAYNLVAGTYYFRLTVTDNDGATKSDDVKVTVNSTTSGSTNKAPIVSAGSDHYLTLPDDDMTIVGSASDPDGSIASYQWTKVSGGSVSMSNTNTRKLWVDKTVAGTYVFRLTVKDNDGAAKYDEVKLTVKSSSTASNTSDNTNNTSTNNNVAPTVYAGSDKTIYLPDNDITLVSQVSDKDGYISSFKWTKVSGNYVYMSKTTTPKLWVDKAKAGYYTFRLTVKDNDGAVKYDDVRLTVKSSTASLILKEDQDVNIRLVASSFNPVKQNTDSHAVLLASDNIIPSTNSVFSFRGTFGNVLYERRRMTTAEENILQA